MCLQVDPQPWGDGLAGLLPGRGWGCTCLRCTRSDPPAPGQVLSGALTVALSGRCDQEVLRLLLAFPEDGTSRFAARELCGLPRATAYSLLVSMSRNLDLRSFIYKVGGDGWGACVTWVGATSMGGRQVNCRESQAANSVC